MAKTFEDFLETLEPNSAKFAEYYSAIGEEDYSNCTAEQMERVILSLNPGSPRTITTICYLMTLYAKFLGNDDMQYAVKDIDRNVVWEKAKPYAPRKFLSNARYEEICHDIDTFEEHNALYKRVLFQCVYEGVYSDDMSVLKNLRGSDVHGNVVTLRDDDGEIRKIEIPELLAKDLVELSKITTWERKNRYTVFNIDLVGEYPDTCFKFEIRQGGKDDQYKNVFYRILREINKKYVEHRLAPSHLYASGLMYRICKNLTAAGFDAKNAFLSHNVNSAVATIISRELLRCGYTASVQNFKEFLRGHTDVFFEDAIAEQIDMDTIVEEVEDVDAETDYYALYLSYVCPQCFCSLDECKCSHHPTSLIHIDRNIQQHIRILHDKGYATLFCCESHYGMPSEIYISFAREYGFGDGVSLPNGFQYNRNYRQLQYSFRRNLSEEQMNQIKAEKLEELLQWCENLPNISHR